MLRKAATVRYISYILGTSFTILNLFLITSYLDIFQFAVWGVANSLIYIFSQLGQLTYVQYIEKYFPTFNKKKMDYFLYKFIKTISSLTILWLLILFVLDYAGYFDKYNADNIFIIFLIISFLTTVESSIEVSSKYLLALEESRKFDLYELLIFKLFRLIPFYFLLINSYSVYYLLLTNLIIRGIFLINILNYDKRGFISIFKSIKNSKIFDDNFKNLPYTSVAFTLKTLQATFLNVIFLILTVFSDNETIANYSLGILIINNIRPIISSLSSLLSPIITLNISKNKDNTKLLDMALYVNGIIIAFVVMSSFIVTEYKLLINYFLDSFDDDIYQIILFSVYASSISSLYYPKFINLLFSNLEKKLLKLMLFNYLFLLITFYLMGNLFEINLLYFYLLFEVANLIISKYLYKNSIKKSPPDLINLSFWLVSGYVAMNLFNISYNLFFLSAIFTIIFIFDLNNLYKKIKRYDSIKEDKIE